MPLLETMTDRSFASQPEWEVMYRRGLTQAQIATLCSVPKQTVNRAIGWSKRRDAGLEAEHLENLGLQIEDGLTPAWLKRRDDLAAFITQEGRTPSGGSADIAEKRLGAWLNVQRSAYRRGTLLSSRQNSLDSIGPWRELSRRFHDAAAWHERLGTLAAYYAENERWPSYKSTTDEGEHQIGVWLHVQRQQASRAQLSDARRDALDQAVPGWNTWRSRGI